MAIYVPANALEVPAASEHGWSDDEEEREERYFLRDPDQTSDPLPQPYRMLDKMVTAVTDRAWDLILRHQEQREADRLNALIPHYLSSEEVQFPSTINCLTDSEDERYMFAGLADGLGALSTESSEVIAVWVEQGVEIVSLQAIQSGSIYLLATNDNMGVARLFIFYINNFFLVKAMNATDDPIKRNICIKFQLSTGGEFAGISLEDKEDCYLEIYRLMKDAWLIDLDQNSSATQKHLTLKEPLVHQSEASGLDDIKLTPPTLIMRVKRKKFTEYSWKNLTDAHQKIGTVTVVGTGLGHVISPQQWKEEAKKFEGIYENALSKDTTADNEELPSRPTFHFLMLGHILPMWLDTKSYAGTLGLWWSGSHNIFAYALVKPTGKEKPEMEPKPDIVLPNSRPICCCAVNTSASLYIAGLMDGIVTIWNAFLGIPLSVLPIQMGSTISSLDFLGDSRNHPFNSYDRIPKVQILVTCSNSEIYLVTAAGYTAASICTLRERSEDPESAITAVQVVPSMPTLIFLTFRNGSTALVDGAQGTLCHFVLPTTHTIGTPWEPTFAFDALGRLLYIKGRESAAAVSIRSVEPQLKRTPRREPFQCLSSR
ncbi:WD repeat-containing protein 93 isoform X3 [Callorhinchus milii]|uniref:WD repeat-containing protein 93 isoform X3 n=1 Tax=Callorhinchus milii TaxID=7868 RepID=UPI001C3FCCCE|nr:WD repeat-containing protein 93 isoform X3 [Callorhinchus milii]